MTSGWQGGINKFVDWYYQPSNSKFDYEVKQFARNLPIIGGIFQAGDNANRMEDYMSNRGLSWSDVRYNGAPFGQTGGGALANAGVSAMNLYRSASRKQSARKGGRGHPPKGGIPPMPIGLAKEYVTPTGKFTRKYYADFRGGKIRGGQYHVNQNGRKSYPSTYRRYRGY